MSNIVDFHFPNSPAFSMGGTHRTNLFGSKNTPGPDVYLPQIPSKLPSPKWRLDTTEPRNPFPYNGNPGPGEYDPSLGSQGPSFSVGNIYPPPAKANSPGPGYYSPELGSARNKGSSKSFGYKLDDNSRVHTDVPGPGEYNPKIDRVTSGAKIGGGKRRPIHSEADVPGPGRYEIPDTAPKTGVSFSQAHKRSLDAIFAKTAANPGPGAYQVLTEMAQPSKGVSVKGKPKDIITDLSPGPGRYETKNTLSTRSYSVGRGRRPPLNPKDITLPGPGTYQIPEGGGTAWRFGKSKRQDFVQNPQVPGPGAYIQTLPDDKDKLKKDIHEVLKAEEHEFEMANRKNISPGPGAYQVDYKQVLSKGPAFRLGGSKRTRPQGEKATPGPGQYSQFLDIGGPKYSFSQLLSRKNIKNAFLEAGPGSYDIPSTIGAVPKYLFKPGQKKKIELWRKEEEDILLPGL